MMNKSYLPLIAMGTAAVLMAGCFGGNDNQVDDTATNTNTENVSVAAENGSEVTVQYVGRLAGDETVTIDEIIADCEAYEVFDTSYEDVAMACDIYTAQRDYTQWLAFVVGMQQLISGFENSVMGRQAGESYTITIPATEAYGEWSEENIVEVPVEQLPPKMSETDTGATVDYIEGDEIATPFGAITVVATGDGVVSVDANHPLAGEDLIFDIEIVSVTPPTPEALQAIENANSMMIEEAMMADPVEESSVEESENEE